MWVFRRLRTLPPRGAAPLLLLHHQILIRLKTDREALYPLLIFHGNSIHPYSLFTPQGPPPPPCARRAAPGPTPARQVRAYMVQLVCTVVPACSQCMVYHPRSKLERDDMLSMQPAYYA